MTQATRVLIDLDDFKLTFLDSEDVEKHGDHDQSSHGSWSTGSSDNDYGMSHRPSLGGGTEGDMDGASLDNVSNGIYPDDVYSPRGVQIYGTGYKELDKQAHALIMEYRGKPEKSITIYRAIPKDVSTSKISGGEWVTPIKQYAVQHGQSNLNDNYQILTREVKAKEIFTSGDSWLEWGYAPSAFQKHGDHDQSEHGNWATGGGSTDTVSNSMPYQLNPKIKSALDVFEFSDYSYKAGKKNLEEIANSPTAIRVRELQLEGIVELGRFKTLEEQSKLKGNMEMFEPGDNYRQARQELEVGLWGVPEKDTGPIYGYIDTPKQTGLDNQTKMYGEIKITLKDSVVGRTTITAGDSANHGLIPVLLKNVREGKLTNEQVDGAYRSRAFQAGAGDVGMRRNGVMSHDKIDYYEAQIHGGVSLKDIESVLIPKTSPIKQSTISTLESKNIKVIRG